MIKVLNIISDTNIGGAGRTIINYMKYCDRSRFDVSVALPKGSELAGPLRELDTRVIEVDGMADRSMDPGAIRTLKKVIREVNPDIVHTHGSMSGRIAGRQCGKKVIYTRHSAFPVSRYLKKGPGHWLNGVINKHYADRIIAVSPAAAENLTDSGISPDLIDVMMNGVEPVERVSEAERMRTRRKYGVSDGDFVMGIVARIEEYKGHEDILKALKALTDEGRRVKLLIAGTGSYQEELWAKAQTMGLHDSAIFTGFLSDVAPVLSILDVQLNASWGTETSSLSILEGFSMGVPAIVSDYGGNPYLVDDGVNGFIFPVHDDSSLAVLIRLVMDNPEILRDQGANARRIYEERFTGESFARRIEDIYIKTAGAVQNGK